MSEYRPSSILFNIFNRQPILVKDVNTEPDSITVELPREIDAEEYRRLQQLEAIKVVHNFIFSRMTLAKGCSILAFIASAVTYYAAPSTEEALALHKLLLLPVLDLTSVMLCFIVYNMTIRQLCLKNYTMAIILETTYTLVTLMMILVSTIIVITEAIESRKKLRFISGCLALLAVTFQLCSGVMTILKYRPIPILKQPTRSTVNRPSTRSSIRGSQRGSPRPSRSSKQDNQRQKESFYRVTSL